MSLGTADHRPTRISAGVCVGAAGIAGASAIGGSGWWLLLSPLGVTFALAGLWRSDRRMLAVGCAGLVAATLITGLAGGEPTRLVLAVAATFVVWDLGEHAITLGEQLGRNATTWRLEFLHAGVVVGVAVVGTGVVSLTYLFAGGGQPLLALVLLLAGGTALIGVLRSMDDEHLS